MTPTTTRIALLLASWSFAYAAYRAYYAAGGQTGMIGDPVSEAQFRALNAFGAGVILLAGILPLLAVQLPAVGRLLPVVGWVGAVGCCMHALVDMTLRVLSLTGVRPTQLPASVWVSFDRHRSDVQDLFLNEPWFFVEGLLWGALALAWVSPSRRRPWVISAAGGVLVLTVVGVLTGLGDIRSFTFG